MSQQILTSNTFTTAKWIVSATSSDGTHTTIAGALTSASSGDTIFIRPGTYTEDLTLKAGVNLSSFPCDSYTPNVIILGKATATFSGTCSLSGIELKTNSDNCLVVSGSAATQVNLKGCLIDANNNTAISFTSSSGSSKIQLYDCKGNIDTTGIAYFALSAACGGALKFFGGTFENNGASTTASTNASTAGGGLNFLNTYFGNAVTTSGNSTFSADSTVFVGTQTIGGSGSNLVFNCHIDGGSSSAVSVSTGATLNLTNSTIISSNTNAITGVGTLNYGGLVFEGSSSGVNTTTQAVLNEGPSKTIGNSNSGNTNTLTVTNSSNTATSSANILSTVGGGTAADPTFQAVVSGVTTWTWGADNSDSDSWVLAASTALGTTNVMRVATTGEITYPLQSSFLAYLNTGVSNVTGDGTVYTLIYDTEVFDRNSDFNLGTSTFTAPVTGLYFLGYETLVGGGTSITVAQGKIATTARTYQRGGTVLLGGTITSFTTMDCVLADMTAGDTATITVESTDSGGKVDDISGTTGGIVRTKIYGNLVA